MNRKLIIFLAFSCALLVAGYFSVQAFTPTKKISSELLQEANAGEIMANIRSLNSPLVLVNFWASWCEPCKQEFPAILTLKKELRERGLQVVFVSIDGVSDLAAAEEFLRSNHVDFKSFIRGTQDVQFVSEIFPKWEGSVPATVLFAPDLKIVDSWEGDATLEEFRKHVIPYLRGS